MSRSSSMLDAYSLKDPDVRLMLKVRDDDAASFEELVCRYQDRLVRFLAHSTGLVDQAEDLAQEVFMRVYRARKNYQPGAKFSTWLFTIAGNVGANALRSRGRRKEINLTPKSDQQSGAMRLEETALAKSGLMPTRQLDKAELQQVVQLAVASLGERQRMAVMLAKFEHLSYAEIGEVMELSPQAVKSLLSRARENLRDLLAPYFKGGTSPAESQT